MAMLHGLCEECGVIDGRPAGIGGGALVQVLALIHEEFTDPLFSLETLSNLAGLSERHVTRLLKGYLGKTFTGYVRLLRIQKAEQLLTDSDASVKMIARTSGFGDISWFTQYFRAATGFTPAQFRKCHAPTDGNVRFRLKILLYLFAEYA